MIFNFQLADNIWGDHHHNLHPIIISCKLLRANRFYHASLLSAESCKMILSTNNYQGRAGVSNDITIRWQKSYLLSQHSNASATSKASKGQWWKFELHDTSSTSKASKDKCWNFELLAESLVWYPKVRSLAKSNYWLDYRITVLNPTLICHKIWFTRKIKNSLQSQGAIMIWSLLPELMQW